MDNKTGAKARNLLNPHKCTDKATVFENEMRIVRRMNSFLEISDLDEQQAGSG